MYVCYDKFVMKKASLEIAADDIQTLQKILRCPTSEARELLRAKIILGFADNKSGYRQRKLFSVKSLSLVQNSFAV